MVLNNKNLNKNSAKLMNERLANVKYNLKETQDLLSEIHITEQVQDVLASPSLRKKYFAE